MSTDHSSPHIDIANEQGHTTLSLAGHWTIAHDSAMELVITRTLAACRGHGSAKSLTLNLSDIENLDGTGISLLLALEQRLRDAHMQTTIDLGTSPFAALLTLYQSRTTASPTIPQRSRGNLFKAVGQTATALLRQIYEAFVFIGRLTRSIAQGIRSPVSIQWRAIPELISRAGADGLAIVVLTNALIGAIMAFQGALQLQQFGATNMTPMMVTIAHLRELGPIMTAFIVAGRSGAGFAAELGTMQVSEEIDALQVMGLDPIRWLVIPRLLALLLVLPLLTIIGNAVGLLGGMFATLAMADDMTMNAYWLTVGDALHFSHFAAGISKTFAFAGCIAAIACAQGLAARGGAAAVGLQTTAAVVLSLFSVVALDCIFAILFAWMGV